MVTPFDFFILKIFLFPCNICKILLTLYKRSYLALTTNIPSAEMLVQQCIDGDAAAYKILYDRYARAMYNTALRIVNKIPDAEDLLQEAFADAFLQIRSFEKKSTFGAWLKQIVIFKSINFLKKQRLSFMDMETAGTDVAEEKEIDEQEIWFTVESVKQKMKKLPDGYRTVLSLYLLEGYDQEEIAEILNITHSTVRTQYIRAKQKLLQLLKKMPDHE
jgi:RNA polymerase sigma factor (sigma-70 family)